jgi:hypothetical protein
MADPIIKSVLKDDPEEDIDDMKIFICHNAVCLDKPTRLDILGVLMRDGYSNELKESADGTRIILDNTNNSTIKEIYNIIKYKKNG